MAARRLPISLLPAMIEPLSFGSLKPSPHPRAREDTKLRTTKRAEM
jgi:hypothetical protein